MRSITMSKNIPLLQYYLARPICIVLLIMICFSIFAPFFMAKLNRKARGKDADQSIDLKNDD